MDYKCCRPEVDSRGFGGIFAVQIAICFGSEMGGKLKNRGASFRCQLCQLFFEKVVATALMLFTCRRLTIVYLKYP